MLEAGRLGWQFDEEGQGLSTLSLRLGRMVGVGTRLRAMMVVMRVMTEGCLIGDLYPA